MLETNIGSMTGDVEGGGCRLYKMYDIVWERYIGEVYEKIYKVSVYT